MKLTGQIFVLLIVGAVVAVVGWGVFFAEGASLVHQYRAQSFPKTDGTVVSASVTTAYGSKGRVHYHPVFRYTYEVNGHRYHGSVYRYSNYPRDQASVNEIVGDHPAGSVVDVYYNPQDPADALLAPQVIPPEVSQMFLFTGLFLVLIWGLGRQLRDVEWRDAKRLPAGGVKILSRSSVTRARLPRYSPGDVALPTALVICAVAGLLIYSGVAAPASTAGIVGAVAVLAGSVVMFCWQYRKIASGRQDLVIDEDARTVQLPMTYRRKQQRQVPFAEIGAVILEQVRHQSRSRTFYTYAPTLKMKDGSSERLADFRKNRAEAFGRWLQEKLGLATGNGEVD